jgi:hypothetical protein
MLCTKSVNSSFENIPFFNLNGEEKYVNGQLDQKIYFSVKLSNVTKSKVKLLRVKWIRNSNYVDQLV